MTDAATIDIPNSIASNRAQKNNNFTIHFKKKKKKIRHQVI